MPFEDVIREVLQRPQPASAFRWRRCTRCGSISYATPGSLCGLLRVTKFAGGQQGSPAAEPCGGDLSRLPGWQTMLAPATADEAWLRLAARFSRAGRIADAIGCLARATQTEGVVTWRWRLAGLLVDGTSKC